MIVGLVVGFDDLGLDGIVIVGLVIVGLVIVGFDVGFHLGLDSLGVG